MRKGEKQKEREREGGGKEGKRKMEYSRTGEIGK
jgi:hypothetical protein